ncbi:VOC family protein [Synechococcus sp. Cruz CV-v-12]|uniref:VOC family protein n=1 Tax=Synechococcus sp. Cruz CV-v-12 TaxID=2823728 RepID=UPI0020CE7F8F|nr:VOC family protein [Synechococcus sp. Cruz CV-v-12]
MEKLSNSILLAAADPAALAAFYAALLQVEVTPGLGPSHWRVPWPAGGRLALCLQRSSEGRDRLAVLNAWLEASAGLGAELVDPDGNRLLLLLLLVS